MLSVAHELTYHLRNAVKAMLALLNNALHVTPVTSGEELDMWEGIYTEI